MKKRELQKPGMTPKQQQELQEKNWEVWRIATRARLDRLGRQIREEEEAKKTS